MNFRMIEKKLENVNDLKELFTLWTQAHKVDNEWKGTTEEGIPKDSFVEDGYICENTKEYNGILFILLEANILNYVINSRINKYRGNQCGFYREYINNKVKDNKPKMKEKMGRMAYYVSKGEVVEECNFKIDLYKSAFMNFNKRGGGKHPKKEILFKYCSKYKRFIQKQIELINPNFIICIGSYKYLYDVGIINSNKCLNVWHTAYGMSYRRRNHKYKLKDSNVDLYMEEFVDRYNKQLKI